MSSSENDKYNVDELFSKIYSNPENSFNDYKKNEQKIKNNFTFVCIWLYFANYFKGSSVVLLKNCCSMYNKNNVCSIITKDNNDYQIFENETKLNQKIIILPIKYISNEVNYILFVALNTHDKTIDFLNFGYLYSENKKISSSNIERYNLTKTNEIKLKITFIIDRNIRNSISYEDYKYEKTTSEHSFVNFKYLNKSNQTKLENEYMELSKKYINDLENFLGNYYNLNNRPIQNNFDKYMKNKYEKFHKNCLIVFENVSNSCFLITALLSFINIPYVIYIFYLIKQNNILSFKEGNPHHKLIKSIYENIFEKIYDKCYNKNNNSNWKFDNRNSEEIFKNVQDEYNNAYPEKLNKMDYCNINDSQEVFPDINKSFINFINSNNTNLQLPFTLPLENENFLEIIIYANQSIRRELKDVGKKNFPYFCLNLNYSKIISNTVVEDIKQYEKNSNYKLFSFAKHKGIHWRYYNEYYQPNMGKIIKTNKSIIDTLSDEINNKGTTITLLIFIKK